jgi:hypothetical protein
MPSCEAYWKAASVFSGEVVAVGRPRGLYPSDVKRVTLRVDRRWRGDVVDTVDVDIRQKPDVPLEPGERYLVYESAYGNASRVMPIHQAEPDLEYLERAERYSAGATVTGTVSMDGDSREPAPGYKVVMGNADREWTGTTDADGVFRFTEIPPGRYGIMVVVPDAYRASGPTLVDIPDARACAEPQFRLTAQASVGLFVLDASGKPAVRTTLELIDAETLTQATPQVVSARTSPDGSVRWGRVRAGRRYVIGLNVTQVPDPKRPQPILFFPGVTDIRSAHTFEVGPGEKVELDTLRLPEPPARLNVTGVVTRPDGTPLRLADVVLKSAAPLSRGKPVGARVKTDAQGRFSIPAVAGYRYQVDVLLSVEGQNARLYASSPEFDLTEKTPALRISRKTGE